MKFKFIYAFISIIFTIYLSSNVFSQQEMPNFKPGSEPDGFRGIKWGTEISKIQGMKYFETDTSYGGIKRYKRKGDDLDIGAAKVKDIIYEFWKGKLCGVTIYSIGIDNWDLLKDVFFIKFGEGIRGANYIKNGEKYETKDINKYYWFGNTSNIIFDYYLNKLIIITIYSRQIAIEQKLWEKQKSKEGAEKGF